MAAEPALRGDRLRTRPRGASRSGVFYGPGPMVLGPPRACRGRERASVPAGRSLLPRGRRVQGGTTRGHRVVASTGRRPELPWTASGHQASSVGVNCFPGDPGGRRRVPRCGSGAAARGGDEGGCPVSCWESSAGLPF